MAIRITDEQLFTVESGETKRKITGFCNANDKANLPTTNIVNGSYMLFVDTVAVSFFDEDTGEWG